MLSNNSSKYTYFCILFLVAVVSVQCLEVANHDIIRKGKDVINNLYQRFSGKEVDLVFVLDRSASIPTRGWRSMITFIRSILEHFSVTGDHTRVAIITYGSHVSLEINDLNEKHTTKCSLMKQIKQRLEKKMMAGYTATYDALKRAQSILLNSRRNAKKAVFVLTDGKSNVGPNPIRASLEIRSLRWNNTWNSTAHGPQVEIYAFGIKDANLPELKYIASQLKNHTFFIPDFSTFSLLARQLHNGSQKEIWEVANRNFCDAKCSKNAVCSCGTRIGQYQCICKAGYEGDGITCKLCAKGYFKKRLSPGKCKICPDNSTTTREGAEVNTECICHPSFYRKDPNDICKLHYCEKLADIQHGYSFHVEGVIKDEVPNTNISCKNTPQDSCHYQCDVGYRLDSNPVLVCERNGTWSGTVPKCKVVDCKTLTDIGEDVQNGVTSYLNRSTTYGSYVSVRCSSGWQAFGDTLRMCNSHGVWSGTRTWCIQAKCKPLPSVDGGSLKPRNCSQRISKPGVICRYSCEKGYRLVGPPQKKCGSHGEWNNTKETRCVDVERPRLTCPADMVVPARNGYATVHINTENLPMSDNSGYVRLTYSGFTENPALFKLGFHQIEFFARDRAGNNNSCTQTIQVLQETVRLKYCPPDINITVESEFQIPVTWKDPIFLDKDDNPVEFYCSHPNGSKFIVGHYNNLCAPVKDYGQNVKCKFLITLERKTCETPPAPKNGALTCTEQSQVYLQVCMAHCHEDYDFFTIPQTDYKCLLSGEWSSELWPDCSLVHIPGAAAMEGMFEYYYFSGRCHEAHDEIRSMFRGKLGEYINKSCTNAKCKVENIEVVCPKTEVRRRRDTKNAIKLRYSRRVQRDTAKVLEIRFKIVSVIDKEDITPNDLFALRRILGLIDIQLKKQGNMNIESNVSNIIGNLSVSQYTKENIEIEANCSAKNMITVDDSRTKKCVNCPIGYFFKNDTCHPCPIGSYQDEEGKTECMKCPPGSNTLSTKSKDIKDCRKFCQPGTYSGTGYAPCQLCELSTYQENYNSTSCRKCPGLTITTTFAATHLSQCSSPCEAGSYNESTGLKPCTLCPKFTYQPSEKSKSCILCPENSKSRHKGATSIYQCQYKDFCKLKGKSSATLSSPCKNNGTCHNNANNFTCRCLEGFEGKTCEINIDDCERNPCDHGTCVDGINSFTCRCRSGYTGDRCEQEINECDSSPCLNSGSCEDKLNGFKCYCSQNFTGKYCEVEFDHCSSSPCSSNGICKHVGHTFRCRCYPGYTGKLCNLMINHCRYSPCMNGATCKNSANSAICSCAPGFTGQYCESEVNECQHQVCKHGGYCTDLLNDYHCSCFNGYAGKNCQLEVSPDFDLVFEDESITDYAQVWFFPNPSDITITFWMRTSDVSSLGTMISYKKESNLILDHYNFALYDYGSLQLTVNGDNAIIGISLNDGMWQHIAVTWTSTDGKWQVFRNGTKVAGGKGLASGTSLPQGGMLFIGQDANVLYGAANSFEAYVGEITQMNVYDEVLSDSHLKDIANQKVCNQTLGNVLTWSEIAVNVKGNLKMRKKSLCLDINECFFSEVFECNPHMICNDTLNGYKCSECIYGYEGPNCDKSINECHLGVCQNRATCIDGPNPHDYTCICTPNFTGRTCADELFPCSHPDQCGPSKTCIIDGKIYYCRPKSGHMDIGPQTIDCDIENPCQNGGVCIRRRNKPDQCKCRSKWKGEFCDVEFQPTCELYPCLNNGTCVPKSGANKGYTCICPALNFNTTAQLDDNCALLNPCDSFPCQNNGICLSSKEGGFTCECVDNYYGKFCELTSYTNIPEPEECDLDMVCYNSGTCVRHGYDYKCICTLRYTGKLCGIEQKQVKSSYDVTVEIHYPFSKISSPGFKTYFSNQLKKLYQKSLKKVQIKVNIKKMKPGFSFNDTVVQFDMIFIEYINPENPKQITDTYTIKRVIEDALYQHSFGELQASHRHFSFQEATDRILRSSTVFYVLLAIFILAIVAVGVWIYFRKFRRKEQSNINSGHNNWNEMQQTTNPAYSPTLSRRPPPPIPIEDNHYAELSDVVPNYMKSSPKAADIENYDEPLEIKTADDNPTDSLPKISPLTKHWSWFNEEPDKEKLFKLQDGVSNRAYDAGDYMVPVSERSGESTADEKEVDDDDDVQYVYESQPQYLELDDAAEKTKLPVELKPALPKLDDDLPPPSPPALPPPPPHELRPLQPSPVARPRSRSPAHSAMLSQRKLPPLPTRRKRH
ncbi:sushi, von Willebrand factor type A, EGF and pentraxin domain-containing protein 1-like [Argonauta hians]